MKVVVFGKPGGREQALARKMREQGHEVVLTINPEAEEADLYVGGPEAPLVDGMADRLRAQGKLVFGPGADGARLEGSKAAMKAILKAAGVPTARYGVFFPDHQDEVEGFFRRETGPWAIKTDYLAGGKGVLVTGNPEEATADAMSKLQKGKIVVEEALEGREFSVFAVCDGTKAVSFGSAQDYKYLPREGKLYMTGGVGSYSPVDWINPELIELVMQTCIQPTLEALQARGIDYRGVLYWGGMLLPDGRVMTLEYNIRFGDPEIQAILPRLKSDLAELLLQAAQGNIQMPVEFSDQACVCVVLCSENYPDTPRTGDFITGVGDAEAMDGVHVLQAGTSQGTAGELLTAGGRVLNVVAASRSAEAARLLAYQATSRIYWPGIQYHPGIALP